MATFVNFSLSPAAAVWPLIMGPDGNLWGYDYTLHALLKIVPSPYSVTSYAITDITTNYSVSICAGSDGKVSK